MIRVLVNGAKGRMGTEVVRAVSAQQDMELVGRTDAGDDLAAAIGSSGAQVVVDFTTPQVVFEAAKTILKCGARPVIGTTGLTAEQVEVLKDMARTRGLGGVIAPNFAIGAVLLMQYAEHAARWFSKVEIIELHHDKKLDSPSGTAKLTAERIARNLPRSTSSEESREPPFRGGRVAGIPVHSVRLPGLVAHQEVIFGGPGQCLTIRHDSLSRESFMPGVLLAVRKAPELKELVVGLDKLLGE